MELVVVILAAGKGSRMHSDLPKVLHQLAGKPLLAHVMDAARSLNPQKIVTVYGHGGDQVQAYFNQYKTNAPLQWVLQEQQLGTGHAVAQTLPHISAHATVLILYGDVPLIASNTLQSLVAAVNEKTLALLTVETDQPQGYGRIIRDKNNQVCCVIEQKDATPEQQKIREINTGMVAVPGHWLKQWLPNLKANNAQGEYYLTDIIKKAVEDHLTIQVFHPQTLAEVEGVNDRKQLAALERCYQAAQAEKLLLAGVTLLDPQRFDLRGTVEIGKDTIIDVNIIIEGQVKIGSRVMIGANVILNNVVIGDDVVIKPFTHIENSIIEAECEVGPYARLRPGTHLSRHAKVGNFVEVKDSLVGEDSKINHLSYVGNAELGKNVNVGAGTITCNYDGANKHKTIMKDNAFIGSNASLVAPVIIGEGATVGAGSVISKNAPDGKLTLTRAKQETNNRWQRPRKQ